MTLEEWNLGKKNCFAVSDNANNIKSALSKLELKHWMLCSHVKFDCSRALKIKFNLIEKI